MTHYLLYKITNLVNGKTYIGKHVTKDIEDNYWGSGSLIKKAIQKYGLENFKFEVLIDLKNEEELDLLEQAVVNEDFVSRPDTYNMKVGGDGGWAPMPGEKNPMYGHSVKEYMTEEEISKWRANISKATSGENNPMYGYQWSDEQRAQMSVSVTEAMQDSKVRAHISEVRKAQCATMSEEERKRRAKPMSDAVRGSRWWNNGVEVVLSKECPGEGWKLGNLNLSSRNTGCHWWNNGVKNTFAKERPPGYSPGLLRKKKG